MEYTLVFATTGVQLVEAVQERIKLGWSPLGGVAVAFIPEKEREFDENFQFVQAMTKDTAAQREAFRRFTEGR